VLFSGKENKTQNRKGGHNAVLEKRPRAISVRKEEVIERGKD